MTIHVVGLGPGAPGLLTGEVAALLNSGLPVLVRTRHHPTVVALDPDGRWESCDDLYAADDFESAYRAMARRVLDRFHADEGIYAVPGHPRIAERSVAILEEVAADRQVQLQIHAGLSYVDLAGTVPGVEADRLQLCDALALRIDPRRPALIAQLFDRDTATNLKLALLDVYPAEHEALVLTALGSAEQSVSRRPLAKLDHTPVGYLDTLYVPPLDGEDDVRTLDGLAAIVARLNAPDGCPWDNDQTHTTLRHYLLEEAYEALQAIDEGDREALAEELGDVLLQVFMHAEVARREQTFSLGDITESIGRKLIRRHPHVFGTTAADTAAEVAQNWEEIKKQEKPEGSILDGVPLTLPALAASQSIQGRARRIGFDWPDIDGPLEKLREELAEFARAESSVDREDEFGDILFVIANIADHLKIDAEQALRGANAKFRRRFRLVESFAGERGLDLKDLDLPALDALWDEAKQRLAAGKGQ